MVSQLLMRNPASWPKGFGSETLTSPEVFEGPLRGSYETVTAHQSEDGYLAYVL